MSLLCPGLGATGGGTFLTSERPNDFFLTGWESSGVGLVTPGGVLAELELLSASFSSFFFLSLFPPVLLGPVLPSGLVLLSSGLLVCFLRELALFTPAETSGLASLGPLLSETVRPAGLFFSAAEDDEDGGLEVIL